MSRPAIVVVLVALAALPSSADDWPAFRGPTGSGLSAEKRAPLSWGADQNVKWKAALPQPGNGSPIVSNGRVFVTCSEDKAGRQRSLYCFDRKDGKKLWTRTVEFAKELPTHPDNMFCPTTPAADGERVVVWEGSAGLYCYDFSGKELWKRDLGEFIHHWGEGTSPVIHGKKVLLHTGPGKRVFMTALSLADGKTLWETEEPVDAAGPDGKGEFKTKDGKAKLFGSWSTPVVVKVDGREQAVCMMPNRVVAYDLESGKAAWWCDGLRHVNAGKECDLSYSSVVVAGDVIFVVGGYGGPGMGIRLGGQGDVAETHRLWRFEKRSQSIGSGVFLDGVVYAPDAGGAIECVDPKTGKILWREKTAKGQIWGSIVLAGGRLYVTNQAGVTVVFKPDPAKFELLGTNDLGEKTNSTPAASDGQLFLRTHKHLYCIAE